MLSYWLRLAHRLLVVLMAITVLVLMVPVTLQIGSRFTEWIPRYMWTEEMSRFFLYLDGHDRRHGGGS